MAAAAPVAGAPSTGGGKSSNPGAILALGAGGALLGGLLGGAYAPNDPNATTAGSQASDQFGQGANEYNIGQGYATNAQAENPVYQTAANNEIQMLEANPYTDEFAAGQQAQQAQKIGANYNAGEANLIDSEMRMGLAQPGSPSSTLAGGQEGLEAARAGGLSEAENQYAEDAIQQRYRNLDAATKVAGDVTGNENQWGIGNESLGNNTEQMSTEDMIQLAQLYAQEQQAGASGIGAAAGGITSLIGKALPL